MALDLAIDPALLGRVQLGLLVLSGVAVGEADPALAAEVDALCAELKSRYGGKSSAEVPGAADARALYKALGLDPTKTRPASEALLRRALKGEALHRINTLVDAMNLCSLRHQLPFGLYDLDQIHPPVRLRRGAPGEAYGGIGKPSVSVEGRPVLSDAVGPFGNPTSDSARTRITVASKNALLTVYAPSGYSSKRLETVLSDTRDTLVRFCGGAPAEQRMLPPAG
jgi:DNA/RNA-binding domain of Phe-tRNA-synthetase-like protein